MNVEKPTDWLAVAFGVALGALASFQQFKLPPALPLLFKEFAYSKTLAGSFMSIYALAGLVVSIPAGRALAKRGPLPLLRLAFAAMLAGNVLMLCLAASGALALTSRLLESVGFALLAVVGAVVSTTSASERDKPLAVALWASWIPVGQIISTVVAVPFLEMGLWRPLWIATGVATALCWLWGERLFGSAARLAGQIAQQQPAVVAPRGEGATGRLLFLSTLLFGVWSGQYITYVTWLPQYLVENHGLNPDVAARAFLIPCVLVVVFNLYTARILRRGVPIGPLLLASTLLQAACWIALPYTNTLIQGALSLSVYGATSGVTATAIFTIPGRLMGKDAPRGFAAMMAGRNFGVLVGPVLLAQLIALTGDWSAIPLTFGVSCALCGALGIHIARGLASR